MHDTYIRRVIFLKALKNKFAELYAMLVGERVYKIFFHRIRTFFEQSWFTVKESHTPIKSLF